MADWTWLGPLQSHEFVVRHAGTGGGLACVNTCLQGRCGFLHNFLHNALQTLLHAVMRDVLHGSVEASRDDILWSD
jgi:hypothetical protein